MVNLQVNLLIQILTIYKEIIMNSFKLMLAALLLGTFSLTVAGCPGKKEEAAAPAVMDEAAPADDAAPATDEATDEVVEDAE
jgi:hypothetical protein